MDSEYGTENTTFRISKNSHGKSRASHDFCRNAKTRASKAGSNSIYTEPLPTIAVNVVEFKEEEL